MFLSFRVYADGDEGSWLETSWCMQGVHRHPSQLTLESLFLPTSKLEQHDNPLDLYLLTSTTVLTEDRPPSALEHQHLH